MNGFINYYEILGVRPNASFTEIEIAYKGRRTQYHPDKYAQEGSDAIEWATEKMKEINMAYEILSDEHKRRNFDVQYQEFHEKESTYSTNKSEYYFSKKESIDIESRKRKIKSELEKSIIDFKFTVSDIFADLDDELRHVLQKLIVETVEECQEIIVNNIELLPFLSDENESEVIDKVKLVLYFIAAHSYSYIDEEFYNEMGEDVFYSMFAGIFSEHIKSFLKKNGSFSFLIMTPPDADQDTAVIDLMLLMATKPDFCKNNNFSRKEVSSKRIFDKFLSDSKLFRFNNEFIQLIRRDVEIIHRNTYSKVFNEYGKNCYFEANEIKTDYTHYHQKSQSNKTSSSYTQTKYTGVSPSFQNYFEQVRIHNEDSGKVYLHPYIPKAKLVNAINARPLFLKSPPENIFLLVDDTLFGGAAEGLVVTESILSFKEIFSASKEYNYTIPKSKFPPFETDKRKVFIGNDLCIRFTMLHPTTIAAIMNAINQYISDYRAWRGL